DLHVRDADDAAARIAAIAGQVRAAGPRAGAKDADANGSVAVRHLVSPLRVRRADHDLLDPDVRRAVRDAVRLRRLALGVAAGADHPPRAAIPEQIEIRPEIGGDRVVGDVGHHPRHFAVLDLPEAVAAELSVVALLIDRITAASVDQDAIFRVLD